MRLNQILFPLVIMLFFAGCYYDSYIMPETPEITRDVSFSRDIIPIFNQSCNTAGCHSLGGTAPDLTPTNAFNALRSGDYINTTTPESSELYKWMIGERAVPMPLSGPNQNYNAYVLAWIKQGALNN